MSNFFQLIHTIKAIDSGDPIQGTPVNFITHYIRLEHEKKPEDKCTLGFHTA